LQKNSTNDYNIFFKKVKYLDFLTENIIISAYLSGKINIACSNLYLLPRKYLPEYLSVFCVRFFSPEIFNSPLTYLENQYGLFQHVFIALKVIIFLHIIFIYAPLSKLLFDLIIIFL